jgi:hypothetical protein
MCDGFRERHALEQDPASADHPTTATAGWRFASTRWSTGRRWQLFRVRLPPGRRAPSGRAAGPTADRPGPPLRPFKQRRGWNPMWHEWRRALGVLADGRSHPAHGPPRPAAQCGHERSRCCQVPTLMPVSARNSRSIAAGPLHRPLSLTGRRRLDPRRAVATSAPGGARGSGSCRRGRQVSSRSARRPGAVHPAPARRRAAPGAPHGRRARSTGGTFTARQPASSPSGSTSAAAR